MPDTARSTMRPPPRQPARGSRALTIAFFAVYLAMLAWIILWKLEIPWVGAGPPRPIKLVPFAATRWSDANTPLEVLVNLLLFVPFGLYLGLLAPSRRRRHWWLVAAAAAGSSLLLETAQYALAVGKADTTDLIVNTAGALFGFWLLAPLRRRFGRRADAAILRACVIGTALVVLAGVLFAASPLHYSEQDPAIISAEPPAADSAMLR